MSDTFRLDTRRGLNTLVLCRHTSKELEIPEMIDGCRIEAIGKEVFLNDATLESVILPDSVSRIDDSAFQGCASLKHVRFPASLETLGIFAFADCDSLAEVTLPDTLRIISYGCFSVCTALIRVHLPNRLRVIANRAFEECRSLTDVVFPNGLTEIGNAAFYNCSSVGIPKLPDSLSSIGHSAFYFSPMMGPPLGTVELPKHLELIGARAFRCRKLIVSGNPDFDTINSDIQMICAPNIDPVSFTGPNALSAACLGFVEMTENDIPIPREIIDSYHTVISEYHRDLYPQAAKNPALLRYLLRLKIVPTEDIQELIDLCRWRTESRALLLQYSDETTRIRFDTLTLEER